MCGGCGWINIGVDRGSELIRGQQVSPAKVYESEVADDLVIGDERAVYAGSGPHQYRPAPATQYPEYPPAPIRISLPWPHFARGSRKPGRSGEASGE